MQRSFLSTLVLLTLTSLAFGQNTWERSANNPVLPVWSGGLNDPSSYKYTYEPSVLFDSSANLYRMWFVYQTFGFGVSFNIGYAISTDGDHWLVYTRNPVLTVGFGGEFDADGVVDPCVIKIGNAYKMYYVGYRLGNPTVYQIGVATSTYGMSWTKYTGNPVLTVRPETFESVAASTPKVAFDGSQYRMLYTGYNGTTYAIGLATSSDGFAWTRFAQNPVLTRGSAGSWDQSSVTANALFVRQGKYYLFYGGGPYNPIGYATLTDAVTWTKHAGNPVFTVGQQGTWDAERVEYGSMILQDNVLKFWYSGIGYSAAQGRSVWQIGCAISSFVTSAPGLKVEIPSAYRLEQSYPNPFNPETEIKFSLPRDEHVTIKIFDGLGNETQTLMNEQKPSGTYSIRWKPESTASGVYYYRMTAGSYSETKRMMFIK